MKFDIPQTKWDVQFDQTVVDALKDSKQSSQELYENLMSTVRAVAEDPLKGAPKTGELRGCRSTHIEHLVLVWEVRAKDSGNPITSRDHIDKVGEVYFHGIGHHDRMTQLVNQTDRSVDFELEWRVRYDCYDVTSEISRLHDLDEAEVEREDWGEGVSVSGTVSPESVNELTEAVEEGEVSVGAVRVSA